MKFNAKPDVVKPDVVKLDIVKPGHLRWLLLWALCGGGLAVAGESVDEKKAASADGYVKITVVRGKVEVKGWDRDEIHVTGTLDEATHEFVFDVTGDEAMIEVQIDDDAGWGSMEGSNLAISVPEASRLSVSGVSTDVSAAGLAGDVEVGLVSGDLDLRGGAGRVSLQTVSGDIDAREAEGRLTVKTVSGDVEARAMSGEGAYSSVSGDIEIRESGGEMTVQTVSGDVEVVAGAISALSGYSISGDVEIAGEPQRGGDIEFDSVSGNIRLALGGDPGLGFDIETASGSIRNTITDDKPRVMGRANGESLRFSVGDGEGRVVLRSRSGDISVSPR